MGGYTRGTNQALAVARQIALSPEIVEYVVVTVTAIFATLLFYDLRARETTARVDTMAP